MTILVSAALTHSQRNGHDTSEDEASDAVENTAIKHARLLPSAFVHHQNSPSEGMDDPLNLTIATLPYIDRRLMCHGSGASQPVK